MMNRRIVFFLYRTNMKREFMSETIKDKQLVSAVPEDIFKKFKHLSVDRSKTMRDLLIEAILDLMVKYENSNVDRE